MYAKNRGFLAANIRCLRLGKPHMRRHHVKRNVTRQRTVLVQDRLAKLVVAEPAAAIPLDRLGDSALLAVHDLLQPDCTMRLGVVAHLDADPPPPHLVRNRRSRPASQERIKNQIALIRRNLQHTLNQTLWLRRGKRRLPVKHLQDFLLRLVRMTDILVFKQIRRWHVADIF